MAGKLTKAAYEQLIKENLIWLARQERTVETMHIEQIVKRSVDHEYPNQDDHSCKANRPYHLRPCSICGE